MVSSISGNNVSSWASSLFSKLDTKNQGYIEKSDLQAAFTKITESEGAKTASSSTDIDDVFKQMDSDSDGKVTESELSSAMTRVAEELDSQFNQMRMKGAGGGHGGMPPPPSGEKQAEGTENANSSGSNYIAAADTNDDGTVSAEELSAYYAGGSSTSDSALGEFMNAMGSMPPPGNRQATDKSGFTKDELASQLEEIGTTDSKRSKLISSLVNNFDKADADGDGKISMDEARSYDKSADISGTSASGSLKETDANTKVQMTIMKLLQAYGLDQDSTSSNLSAIA